ncbi:MAG: hypothetical protein IPG04_07405 [Polyangiaceae bacterium]|nr:hypothetical protein [Polyangiaceae bacterium]
MAQRRPARGLGRRALAWSWLVLMALVASLAVGCKDPPAKKLTPSELTSAELRMVRRGVTVIPRGESERAPYGRERLGDGAEVKIAAGGLAWLRRDGGTTLLARGPGKIVLKDDTLRVESGKVFAETPAGQTETLLVPEGPVVLSAVRASLDVENGKTRAYVLEGELRAGPVVARAGEVIDLAGGTPKVEPALSWDDWTGGLATTDPASEPAPFGVGTVGARLPGQAGAPYAPLTIQRLDVRVKIEGDLAVTEVDQTFFNPESHTVEGVYRFRAPDGALLERFGVDRDGGILYGYVKEKKQAQQQYQSHVYAGSKEDPALLAWQAPGVYEARLYPIGPGATRRVVVRYSEWLARSGEKGERRLFVYPLASEGTVASAPFIEDLSIEIDVSKAGAKSLRSAAHAVRVGETVIVRDHDVIPRADLALELFDDGIDETKAIRAKHVPDLVALGPSEAADARRAGDGEAEYLLVPVRATDAPNRPAGLDVVVVVDTSAATDTAMLRLARAATRAMLAHLGDDDRILVVAGDDRLRPVVAGRDALTKVDDALKAQILEGLAAIEPGGASDLAAMLSDATTKLGDERASAIVYVGDGLSTVGETDLATIRDRLKKAPRLVRTFGLGIGDGAAMATLAGLSTGGFAERVTDDRSAAKSALKLLELAERSVDLGATLDLGSTVERVYPRELGAVIGGETQLVIGRLTGEPPSSATLKTVRGSTSLKLDVTTIDDHGDLRRRWAMGRLDELLSTAAGHAALVDLGVRQGIITPVTSIYVPTTGEMTPAQRASIDRETRRRTKVSKPEEPKADDDARPQSVRAKGEAAASAAPVAAATSSPKEPTSSELQKDAEAERRDEKKEVTAAIPPSDGNMPTSPAPTAAPPMAQAEPAQPGSGTLGVMGGSGAPTPVSVPKPDVANERVNEEGRAAPGKATTSQATDDPGPKGRAVADEGFAEQDKAGFGQGEGQRSGEGLIVIDGKPNVVIIVDDPGRIVRRCGKGADLPFAERKNLWRERLSSTNANPHAVHKVYKNALAWCEAPTMRERRALLLIGLDFLPSVSSQVALHRLLLKDVQAADVVYRGILARVATPQQVRELNVALGLLTVDPGTLETLIKEAKDPVDRVAKLRQLRVKFPDDPTLALRLLDALEDAGDAAGARLLAKQLRKRSDADAHLRTAVGELHLRLAGRAKDPGVKSSDEEEARRAFGEIVEFAPEDAVARRRLGDLYRAHGYYAEAARQYETLARMIPDDPTAMVLLAASANGLGKLEEAVRWTEKGGQAGAPDVTQGPHATARAFAALFLAWGRMDAKAAGKTDEWKALAARLDKVLSGDKREGQVRVLLSWSHPELHPNLWTNALGTMMPASEGDVTLGLSQALVPDGGSGLLEIRVEPSDLEHTARLGAKATLTVIFSEGKDGEVIEKREISFAKDAPVQRFRLGAGKVDGVAVEVAPEKKP